MTNVNAPFGLRPVARVDGAALSFQVLTRQIAYDYTTAIGYGDPVIALNTGYIALYANGGSRIDGVFQGCTYYNSTLQRTVWSPNWPGVALSSSSIVVTAYIVADKNLLYEIQSGSAGAPFADINTNSDIVVGTPNAAGYATGYLDSTHDTTATFPLRIWAMGQGVVSTNQAGSTNGYDPLTGYNIVQVFMNAYGPYNTTGL